MNREPKIQRLLDGEQTYSVMQQSLAAARHSIEWSNFCFERGRVFERFLKPLAAAAKRGVRVRLLADAYGSRDLNATAQKRLRSAGIDLIFYNPLNPSRFWRYNHRLHKKLLTIDGSIGFTGGVGVAEYWQDPSDYPASWRDTHFRISGPAVVSMQRSFARSWNQFSSDKLPLPDRPAARTNMLAIDGHSRGHALNLVGQTLLELINHAQTELTITSAYFAPSRPIRKALQQAARRGVAVRILINGPYTNHPVARDAGRTFQRSLLRAGVQMYEYQPTKIHAKITTVDGRLSYIGSGNLNFRSLYHDEEFNLLVRDQKLTAQLEHDFANDLKQAQAVTANRGSLSQRLRDSTLSLGRYLF